MRASAVRRLSEFVQADFGEASYTIGAHADHRREDFVFPRMQSRTMRGIPWASRSRPMKSWGEIAVIAVGLSAAGCALLLTVTLV